MQQAACYLTAFYTAPETYTSGIKALITQHNITSLISEVISADFQRTGEVTANTLQATWTITT